MSEQSEFPYCDFFKSHDKNFNYGLCPCGDSVVIDGEIRCTRTKAKTKKLIRDGYYFKCEYMRRC